MYSIYIIFSLMEDDILITGPTLNSKTGKTKQLVVFLHGWGSNGEDLIQLAPLFSEELHDAFFLSPDGPEACPQNPIGGRQWFGLDFLEDGTLDRTNTPTKLIKASEYVNKFLIYWQKKYSVKSIDTFLVGFSQGSMLALEVGMKKELGGIVCYSGSFISNQKKLSYQPKVMLIHGDMDEVIPFKNMQNAEKKLKNLGVKISSLECKGLGHSINEIGIKKGIEFIQTCMTE